MFDIIITVIIVAVFGGLGLWAIGILIWLSYLDWQIITEEANIKIAEIEEEIRVLKQEQCKEGDALYPDKD